MKLNVYIFYVLKNYSQDSCSRSSDVLLWLSAVSLACLCFFFSLSYFEFSFSSPSFLALSLPSRQRAENELQ